MVQALQKTPWRFLKNQKQDYHMTQQFHFWVFEENKTTNSKRYMLPHIFCNIIYNSQDMETT